MKNQQLPKLPRPHLLVIFDYLSSTGSVERSDTMVASRPLYFINFVQNEQLAIRYAYSFRIPNASLNKGNFWRKRHFKGIFR